MCRSLHQGSKYGLQHAKRDTRTSAEIVVSDQSALKKKLSVFMLFFSVLSKSTVAQNLPKS